MTRQDSHYDEFLSPRSRYHGRFTPRNLAFNANLQEFSQRVNTICNLETAGKLTPLEAYRQLNQLWQRLEDSHKSLDIAAEGPEAEA